MGIHGLQSSNYVPGVSGVRIDFKTGAIEINGGSVAVGSLPSEPQTITVTAGEWAESDMPANAMERYRFIGDKVMEIPCQYRDSAEFSTEDASFDRDGSDVRIRLTYQRMETAEEAKARALRPADSVVINERGDMTITSGGKVVARLGRWKDDEQPFAVEGDQVFISQAFIDQFAAKAQIVEEASVRASADMALESRISGLEARIYSNDSCDGALRDALSDWKPSTALLAGQFLTAADRFAVGMEKNANGQYVCTGIGLGIDPAQGETKDGQTDMEQAIAKGAAAEILRLLSSTISDARLDRVLHDEIEKIAGPVDAVRQVIREELRPGGMLHRG
ncbi:hypothetical protein D0O09_15405 [Pseudomonas putida]|nr:hypothetical protein D0O09_15405 [Pseudomonas putida]